jgi:hypothetical protein
LELIGQRLPQVLIHPYQQKFWDYVKNAGSAAPSPSSRRYLGGDMIDVIQLSATSRLWVGSDWWAAGLNSVDQTDLTFNSSVVPFRNGVIDEASGTLGGQVFHGGGSGGDWLDAVVDGGEPAESVWWATGGVKIGADVFVCCHLLGEGGTFEDPTFGAVDSSIVKLNLFALYADHVNTNASGWNDADFWLNTMRDDVAVSGYIYVTGTTLETSVLFPPAEANNYLAYKAYQAMNHVKMARCLPADVFDPFLYEFWDGTGWSTDPTDAVAIMSDGAIPAYALVGPPTRIGADAWLMLRRPNVTDPYLTVCRAPAPQGPYKDIARVPVPGIGDEINRGVYQVSHHAAIIPHLADPAMPDTSVAMLTRTVVNDTDNAPAVPMTDLHIRRFTPQFVTIPHGGA